MKPPVAIHRGGSLVVQQRADGMLLFARQSGEPFEYPTATTELQLPGANLVHVHDHGGWLYFLGYFGNVSRPPIVRLGPISAEDSFAVAEALKQRLGLPRLPIVCSADELDERLPLEAYVLATGEYRLADERPNFGRVRLAGSVFHELSEGGQVKEGRYRVLGFYYRPSHSPEAAPVVGYGGPRLYVLQLEPVRE